MEQTYAAQIVREPTPEELREWHEKRGIQTDSNGIFTELPYRGDDPPTERAQILENVRINATRREVPNLHPAEYNPRTMVYIAGGTTLHQFLDEIKRKCEDDRYDVITSNKTCKWLLSNGVKPNYHLILDPQQKKLKDLDYEENVHLILGMQCHPDLFERAKEKGAKVYKFLAISVTDIGDGQTDKELARGALHEGDQKIFCIGGGSMTGTRMLYFAGARGYRRLEYYGFDGNVEVENNVLRCYAYQKFRGENIIDMECEDGRVFKTTMSLGRQAEEFVNLYNEYPGIDIEIYGDSLLSHTLKLYKAKRDKMRGVGRYTPEYESLMRDYHKHQGMGYIGRESAPRVFMSAAQLHRKYGSCSVLDYGCGRGGLIKAIQNAFPRIPGLTYAGYDPFVEGADSEPQPADLVFCGDVMEHIEPQCVDAVFGHISGLTKKMAIFVIALTPAVKTLPDGRNAHICLQKPDWWLSYLRKHFVVIERQTTDALTVACQKLPS